VRRRDPVTVVEAAIDRPPVSWLEESIHRRLIVHTTDDRSIRGLLRLAADDGLLLWGAELLEKEPVKLAGDVFVPRDKVSFVQTDTQ
jgi:hypothetical protein